MTELDHRHNYGEKLRRKVEAKLTDKAEGIYLWVSLVCKRLESARWDEVLATIQSLPPGLEPFYDRIFNQLIEGESADVERSMQLLRVMMLTYRPLNVSEVASVTSLADENGTIKASLSVVNAIFHGQYRILKLDHFLIR